MYRDLNYKYTPQVSIAIQNLEWYFFLRCLININVQNWASEATYKKCRQIYKTSNLSHNKCGILIILYFIWTKYGARWYAPVSSSQVTRSGGSRLVKEHHYGTQRSYSPMSMNSVLSPQFWCNISHIPLQNIQWLYIPQFTVSIYLFQLGDQVSLTKWNV